jgi:hypothetical protein
MLRGLVECLNIEKTLEKYYKTVIFIYLTLYCPFAFLLTLSAVLFLILLKA